MIVPIDKAANNVAFVCKYYMPWLFQIGFHESSNHVSWPRQ